MASETTSFSFPDDLPDNQETAVIKPIQADGMSAIADAVFTGASGIADANAKNTPYVGAHAARRGKGRSSGGKVGVIAAAAIFALLLASLVAYFFVGRWYFQDKAAPGVYLGNVSVTGQTREELKDTVAQQTKSTSVTLSANGKTVTASLKDLGVSVDENKTVDSLLNAKTGDVAKLNVFNRAHVALVATTNNATAEQFATNGLVDEAERAQNTSLVYNRESGQFDVVEGKDGQEPNPATVKSAVEQAIAAPGETHTVSAKLVTAQNPVDDASAQQAQADANARLALNLTVDNGVNRNVTIPAETIASFITTNIDKKTGAMSLAINRDAITQYVSSEAVTKELTVSKVTRETYITPKSEGGVEIGADKTLGVDGITVTGPGNAPDQLAGAIESNQSSDSTVAVKDDPYDVKQVEVPHNFDVANGDKWVHVDLTNQTATAYQGTTPVKTFLIASGLPTPDRISDTGTFYVYLKYEQQTMTGPGYSQPTPWISYYNGGEALHAVPPYMWGDHPIYVQQGIPGSHGCINMQIADAKWMYDWAVIGTRVVVDGTTPTSGQPLREAGADATGWQGA
ncbi:L,D-transpeptidase [Bifidobacterium scaligerum]|uniref:Murein L,D-transpeptidase n=1 Tax=Bifidobacterium scaligerum TaxID=2052656 RepID=A0A2M9HPW3_9BIFI|nr:L,D-transpeptidase [Bifidobacterium scaligerum]PJM78856.1 murein L,D-transpeptidase [Bifidobacterium scaligerum]